MSGNKMALDALTAIVEADDAQCLEQSHIEQARAAIAALQAEPQPDEADLRQLMGMNEAEIDAELLAAGISPDDAVKRADRAIKGALATVRAERRAIEYGDIVHKQVVAMRAAVVAAKLESPEVGIQWIANTLFGPGHYPDIEAARELGGAQALFDKEMAEHEAFRAAHPAPVAAQPSQAPVVQASTDANHVSISNAFNTGGGTLMGAAGLDADNVSAAPVQTVQATPKLLEDLKRWAEQNQGAYLIPDWDGNRVLRHLNAATTAQAVRMLTAEEIKALTAMVWGAPCSGHDLAVFTSAVKAMEALRPGERPMDPADGGRLLEVDACGDPMPSGRTIPPSGVIGGAA